MMIRSEPNAGLLRYELFPGEPLDEFSMGVLSRNPPPGVLRLGRETTEEYDHLLLPVAGLLQLQRAASILQDRSAPDNLMEHVTAVRDALPRYMLPPETLVLRPEFTWLDPETGAWKLLCLPTPLAADLSLPEDEYAALVRHIWHSLPERVPDAGTAAGTERKTRKSPRSFRRIVKEFWEDLD